MNMLNNFLSYMYIKNKTYLIEYNIKLSNSNLFYLYMNGLKQIFHKKLNYFLIICLYSEYAKDDKYDLGFKKLKRVVNYKRPNGHYS